VKASAAAAASRIAAGPEDRRMKVLSIVELLSVELLSIVEPDDWCRGIMGHSRDGGRRPCIEGVKYAPYVKVTLASTRE
jgi:hypothetical protein